MSQDSNRFEMTQRLDAKGGNGGKKWDNGADHDGVTKIYVKEGIERGLYDGIHYIYFDYVKNGQPINGSPHDFTSEHFTTFEINHLNNEYLESVEGYYKTETNKIQALQFKTNFRTSESIGYHYNGTKFALAVERKMIIGFHGSSSGKNLNSLGAYFTCITPTKVEAKGGKGGKEWDDGIDHEGVTKIHVRGGLEGIQFIKFDYVKNGQQQIGQVHGLLGSGFTQLFEINHNDKEYLVSVDGYYDETSSIIQSLQFKTNANTSEMMGYEKGKKFSLESYGKKIIGFHGYAEKYLNSLGAYFATLPPTKLEREGGTIGSHWDDGAFHGVRKIYVAYSVTCVMCVTFEYDNNGKVEKRQHGYISGQEGEFVVDYPDEFITSVEGTLMYDTDTWVTSLSFKTSKGRTSETFGAVTKDNSPSDFVLESKGCALVGFHGRSTESNSVEYPDTVLIGLGAYFHPLPLPPPSAENIEAQDGDRGSSWDDGCNCSRINKLKNLQERF